MLKILPIICMFYQNLSLINKPSRRVCLSGLLECLQKTIVGGQQLAMVTIALLIIIQVGFAFVFVVGEF
jgi:hypothetical protein